MATQRERGSGNDWMATYNSPPTYVDPLKKSEERSYMPNCEVAVERETVCAGGYGVSKTAFFEYVYFFDRLAVPAQFADHQKTLDALISDPTSRLSKLYFPQDISKYFVSPMLADFLPGIPPESFAVSVNIHDWYSPIGSPSLGDCSQIKDCVVNPKTGHIIILRHFPYQGCGSPDSLPFLCICIHHPNGRMLSQIMLRDDVRLFRPDEYLRLSMSISMTFEGRLALVVFPSSKIGPRAFALDIDILSSLPKKCEEMQAGWFSRVPSLSQIWDLYNTPGIPAFVGGISFTDNHLRYGGVTIDLSPFEPMPSHDIDESFALHIESQQLFAIAMDTAARGFHNRPVLLRFSVDGKRQGQPVYLLPPNPKLLPQRHSGRLSFVHRTHGQLYVIDKAVGHCFGCNPLFQRIGVPLLRDLETAPWAGRRRKPSEDIGQTSSTATCSS